MHQRSTSAIALLLLISLGMACTIPRLKKRLAWQIMLEVDASESNKEAVIKRTVSVIQQRLDAAEIDDSPHRTQAGAHFGISVHESSHHVDCLPASGSRTFCKILSALVSYRRA